MAANLFRVDEGRERARAVGVRSGKRGREREGGRARAKFLFRREKKGRRSQTRVRIIGDSLFVCQRFKRASLPPPRPPFSASLPLSEPSLGMPIYRYIQSFTPVYAL